MSSPPTKYARQFNFTDFSTGHPGDQQPGVDIDNELNAAKAASDATIDRLAQIQRDDGALKNSIVTFDSLSADVAMRLITPQPLSTPTMFSLSQSAVSLVDLIVPFNGTHYIDNAQTIRNNTVNADGLSGNAAFNFADRNGLSRAALGYSAPNNAQYFPHILYAEIGNYSQDHDPYDTDFAVVNTHTAGQDHFAGTSYFLIWAQASTGFVRMLDHTSHVIFTFDTEGRNYTVGDVGANSILLQAGASGLDMRITAQGGVSTDVTLRLVSKNAGQVALDAHGAVAFQAQNPASAVNFIVATGSVTGTGVSLLAAGSDTNVDFNITPKAAGAVRLNAKTFLPTPTTAAAPLNIPHGVDPTSPVSGDIWTTSAGLFVCISGVKKTVTLT